MKNLLIIFGILFAQLTFAADQAITTTDPNSPQVLEVYDTLQNSYTPSKKTLSEKVIEEESKKPEKPALPQEPVQSVEHSKPDQQKPDKSEIKPDSTITVPPPPDYNTIVVRSRKTISLPRASTVTADPEQVTKTRDVPQLPKDITLPTDTETKVDITVKPGVTQIVRISKDFLNRIITPFQNPILPTISDFDYTVSDNIVYITPKGDKPISAFITDKNNQKISINVLMIPDNIMPREITFFIEGIDNYSESLSTDALEQMNNLNGSKSLPYLDQITSIMTDLAKGNIPNGFSQTTLKRSKAPQCRFVQMESAPLQMFESINRRIIVYKVTNRADKLQSIYENACYMAGVVAVAPYPNVNLEPNQSTELYLLADKEYQQELNQQRQILVK